MAAGFMAAVHGSSRPTCAVPIQRAHTGAHLISRLIGNRVFARSRTSSSLLRASHVESLGAFVEVGYVTGAHGIKGDVRIVASTDFPEERFQPGTTLAMTLPDGDPTTQERKDITIVKAKHAPTSKQATAWIMQIEGCSTREDAEALRGAALLVDAALRPRLFEEPTEEDEDDVDEEILYADELVGMHVYMVLEDAQAASGTETLCIDVRDDGNDVEEEEGDDDDDDQVSIGITSTSNDSQERYEALVAGPHALVGTIVDVYGDVGPHDLLEVRLKSRECWSRQADLHNPQESGNDDDDDDDAQTALIPFAREICPVVETGNEGGVRYIVMDPPPGLLDVGKSGGEKKAKDKRRRRRRRPKPTSEK